NVGGFRQTQEWRLFILLTQPASHRQKADHSVGIGPLHMAGVYQHSCGAFVGGSRLYELIEPLLVEGRRYRDDLPHSRGGRDPLIRCIEVCRQSHRTAAGAAKQVLPWKNSTGGK